MTSIQLVDAAQFYKGFPHQAKAWNNLQAVLTPEQLETFAEQYRAAPPEEPKPALMVTAAQCKAIFGRDVTAIQLNDLNSCLDRFAIDTPQRIQHFMAQIGHETGGLKWLEEIWGPTEAQKGYEGRRDLGNTQTGDGKRFKGAGAIQLTGRYNYQQFAKYIGDTRVMEGYSYVAKVYPFTSAGYWWHNNQINKEVDRGASCRRISRLVNGRDPANGLDDREAYFAKALKAIPADSSATALEQQATPSAAMGANPLAVPYYSQRDSSTRHADRMCFSSSNAMMLEFLKPGSLPGANGDDVYLQRVLQYGDTTEPVPQAQALASFGIQATRVMNADFSTIEAQIDKGIPVPCGFLHKGHVNAPFGGGHWLCVIGYTETAMIVHDPFGNLDLVGGGYLSNDGKGLLYSRKNFGRRWMVNNDGSYAPGNGWAMIATSPA
ncbi:MAG: C39 family peptidase [Limisphaerales bacterium]|jgi:predicted chitinase